MTLNQLALSNGGVGNCIVHNNFKSLSLKSEFKEPFTGIGHFEPNVVTLLHMEHTPHSTMDMVPLLCD